MMPGAAVKETSGEQRLPGETNNNKPLRTSGHHHLDVKINVLSPTAPDRRREIWTLSV